MKFKVIFASVKTDITDTVVDAAKTAGATGATLIPARRTGLKAATTFSAPSLAAPTDIVMLVLEEHIVRQVLAAIYAAGKFDQPGTGIAFVLPVESVVGLESQLERFKQEVREQYF